MCVPQLIDNHPVAKSLHFPHTEVSHVNVYKSYCVQVCRECFTRQKEQATKVVSGFLLSILPQKFTAAYINLWMMLDARACNTCNCASG